MRPESYTIEQAATLLGIDSKTMNKLIEGDLISLVTKEEEKRVPSSEIARVFNNINDLVERIGGLEGETSLNADCLPKRVGKAGPIVVNDQELLDFYSTSISHAEKAKNLRDKVARMEVKINRYVAISQGEEAKFWNRAFTLYPDLWSASKVGTSKKDDIITIVREEKSESEGSYQERFVSIIAEGISTGRFPNGFLNIYLDDEDDDIDFEEEDFEEDDLEDEE